MASNAAAFKKLTNWSRQVKSMQGIAVSIARTVEADILKDIDTKYGDERDPYGVKWVKRKHVYSWKILNRTGRQRRSYKAEVKGQNIKLSNTSPYAGYHQAGTKKMAKRLVLPEPRRWMPEAWRKMLRDAALKQWRRRMRAA